MEEDNRQDKQEVVEPKQEDDKSSSKKAISIFIAIDILLVIIIIILLCLKSCKDNSNQESNNNNKEGINKNTDNKLIKIPLPNTKPTSKPIEKLININATKPAIVVIDDEDTGAKALLNALIIASSLLSVFSFSSLYVCNNTIA